MTMKSLLFFGLLSFFWISAIVNTANSSSSSRSKFNELFQSKRSKEQKEQKEWEISKKKAVVQDKHEYLIHAVQKDLPRNIIRPIAKDKYVMIIKRVDLIRDTLKKLVALKNDETTPFAMKRKLLIFFDKEVGSGTGLTTEWFNIFSAKAFHPEYGLFKFSNEKSDVVEIDPKARVRHKSYINKFELLGLFTAMALYQKRILNVNFSIPFLKVFLNKSVELEDLKFTDPDYYRFFHKILKNPKSMNNLTFEVEHPLTKQVHYLEGDVKKPSVVTKTNSMQYVSLFIKWKYKEVIKEEMEAFLRGFQILIPLDLMEKFEYNVNDLALIISGEKTIDVGKWRSSTEYINCDDKIKKQFWKIIESFDESTKSKLLEYATGINRIPFTQKFDFTLHCSVETQNPKAHTCWNVLYIGKQYKNIAEMKSVLLSLTKFPLKYSI